MRQSAYVDISGFSFDEFVEFLFDRVIPAESESFASLALRGETKRWKPWYWHTKVAFDLQRVCDYYLRLFREAGCLLERFSRVQLEQGFWAIQTANLDCSAFRVVWNAGLPFDIRANCVRSMYLLFRDLFAREPLEDAVCMWWDSFCYDWHCGNRNRSRAGEDMAMQDVMFETLSEILALESETCQGAALHGISHLHHPSTGDVIERFLARHPLLNEEWRALAMGAARFELM